MGDSLIEKLIILTSPIGLTMLLIGFSIDFYERHVWCRKRWYYNAYDYYMTKRQFDRGVTDKQLKYYKRWLNNNQDHPWIDRLTKLYEKYSINK